VAEAAIRPEQLLAPFFVVPGSHETQPIAALPGVARLSVDRLLPQLERALALGMRSVLLFGVVPDSLKTPGGEAAAAGNGPVVQAIRAARAAFGNELVIISDVCLCAYTDHGHCGLLRPTPRGVVIDNDLSLAGLAAMALAHAEAGADLVAPSDMLDRRVAAIRQALDAQGFTEVGILSYAVKYASAFYGPFREAAGSAPPPPYPPLIGGDKGGIPTDRKTYQLDPRNAREALREAALDEAEGADLLMVKPALPYLDIIAAVRAQTTLPVVAYQVSGEYAMLKAAAAAGACEEPSAVAESLLSIRRAGADMVISYYALEALTQGWLE
jgi:porphobilinogen synthase